MYQDYQKFKIVIYYTENQQSLLKWAKTFWLLKTAHPVVFELVQKQALDDRSLHPDLWIKSYIPQHESTEGIFVPPLMRPLFEIDLVNDSSKTNRCAVLKNGNYCLCRIDSSNDQFTQVSINQVFEDLSCDTGLSTIEEEISLIREKLLMNI